MFLGGVVFEVFDISNSPLFMGRAGCKNPIRPKVIYEVGDSVLQ